MYWFNKYKTIPQAIWLTVTENGGKQQPGLCGTSRKVGFHYHLKTGGILDRLAINAFVA